jgi:hypothetical protein
MTAELTAAAPDVAYMPDGELLSMYANGTDTDRSAILRECRRQDNRRRGRERWRAVDAEWRDGAYSQYLAAESATNGYLLSRAGDAAGIDPWPALWTGPESRAMKYASEELRNFWLASPRTTVSQYAAMAARRGNEWDDLGTEADTAAVPAARQDQAERTAGGTRREGRAMAVTYAEVEPLRTMWLRGWENRIPRGEVVMIAGPGAVGKGQLLCGMAAGVSVGITCPPDGEAEPPGTVIMVTPEDDANETMAWRLRAAGADLSRIVDLTTLDAGAPFELPDSVAALRALIDAINDDEDQADVRLVVIDPLMAVVSRPVSTNLGARRVMAPLMRMAKETGVAVVMVHHTVKSGSVAGSKGLTDVLRYVYTVKRDPENDAIRVMHLDKGNNVGETDDLRYVITGTDHGPRAVWLTRAEVAERRTSWRKQAAAAAPAADHRPRRTLPAVTYAAAVAVPAPGAGKPVTFDLGSHATLTAAQRACQGTVYAAGTPLAWRPEDSITWLASGRGAFFCISSERK